MKISCQSCQAKYTIADEKVVGKIVKIRCKKCGATIVINGSEQAAGGAATGGESQPYDYASQGGGATGGGEQWTVNVADGDQRTMTIDEIVATYRTGVVNDETYCWKDGMGDWLPLREIAELASAVAGGASAPPAGMPALPNMSPDATQQEAPAAQGHDEPTAGAYSPGFGGAPAAAANGNGAGAGLFGSAGATPSPAPAAARRTGARGGGGMDLFGGVAHAGGEDDVMTSAPAAPMPQASDEPGKLTGQRNENSVLFSLSALTQNAPKEEAATKGGEGSGLIDIRALSASMGDKSGEKKSHVDDIMNLGGGGAFSAALAAPVLAPPTMDGGGGLDLGAPRKDNTKLIILAIVGAGALVMLAIILVAVLKKPAEPVAPAPTAMPTDTAAAPTAAATVAQNDTAPTVTTTPAAAAPTAGGPAAPGTGQAASAPAPSDNSGGSKKSGGGGGGAWSGSSKPAPKDNGSAFAASAPAYKPPPSSGGGGGGGDPLAAALRQSVGASAAPPPSQAAASSTASFDRGAASAALSSVNVQSCRKGDGPTGSGHIKITFAPSGSVQSAVVDQPPFAGTSVGGCVAGRFRAAHIPAFGGSPVTVGKSFVIE
jgi:predicted Zn finger-like uncharacterized protein